MPEISQRDLDTLTRARTVLDALWMDKDVGKRIRTAAKEKYPEITLPDEQAEPFVAPLIERLNAQESENKKLAEQLAKIIEERSETDTRAKFQEKLDTARKKYNLTDDGIQAVLARMKDTANYTAVDDAAAWVVSESPRPIPSSGPSWLPQSMNLYGSRAKDEAFESLHRDPQKYQDDQLALFVKDPDAYVRDTFAAAA